MSNSKPRWFSDERDPEKLISEDQLKREYAQHIAGGSIDPAERTFSDYLAGCMSAEGGTLTEVSVQTRHKPTVHFMIRETLTMHVEVHADTLDEAQEEVQRMYDNGDFNLDHNCFAGVEFRPCCAACQSDFEDDFELRWVDDHSDRERLICDRCVADMENCGELTRCENCEDLFSPARLKANPKNGIKELCPLCGEVWCE